MVLTVLLSLVLTLTVSVYIYVKFLYSYWKRRGVDYVEPSFPFGNFGKNVSQKLSFYEQLDEFYRSATGRFVGVFGFFKPTLVAVDPAFIRDILIKDFQHFVDRGVYIDEKNDPISTQLFSLHGDKWKNLRMKLSPTFTSGKMKAMFSTLVDGVKPLHHFIDSQVKAKATVEAREMAARYTTNTIASVAFGIDVDCFADPDNPFRKYGRLMFKLTLTNAFRGICFNVCHGLLRWSRIGFIDHEINKFIKDVVTQTLELREKNNIVRKDLFQSLVQLRNTGTVELDDEWNTVIANDNTKTLSMNEMLGQVFIFWSGGFETTSATISFCLYEIAKSKEIQWKLQDEIDTILAEHKGELTYESTNEMKYLEACIDEALRKYPVVPMLNRECTKEYKIAGTDITLEKGTAILIPVFSLQRNEKYYPNPNKFDPSRFFKENRSVKTIVEMPYFPFGDGPRNCIGDRMGKMTTKIAIASMLRKYNFDLAAEHIGKELEFTPASSLIIPKTGINLIISTRNN